MLGESKTKSAIALAPVWAEAVFHVLAHVDAGRIAASCYEPAYVAWAASFLGDAASRPLAEDARVIAVAASTHDTLARIQTLAWVFRDEGAASAASDRDLAALTGSEVADRSALAGARAAGAPAEILRAAAELELPLVAALPPPVFDPAAVDAAVASVLPAAPSLPGCAIALMRPLGVRGRIFGTSIFVGVPGLACPDAAHVAWQAAHEATVREVQREAPSASFLEIERDAVARLRARAEAVGLAADHARWIARFDLSGL